MMSRRETPLPASEPEAASARDTAPDARAATTGRSSSAGSSAGAGSSASAGPSATSGPPETSATDTDTDHGQSLRQSFFRSSLITSVILIAVLLIPLSLLMNYLIQHNLTELLRSHLAALSLDEAEMLEDPQAYVERYATQAATVGRPVRVSILNEDARIVADSTSLDHDTRRLEPGMSLKHEPDVREAMDGTWGGFPERNVALILSRSGSGSYHHGDYIYRVTIPPSTLRSLRNILVSVLVLALAFAFALAIVVARYLGRRFSAPVAELTRAAKRLAGGDFEARPPRMETSDFAYAYELYELDEAFRRMREELEEAYTELRQSNETMHAILFSMNDGVVAADEEGRAVLLTERVKELLGEPAEPEMPGQGSRGVVDYALRSRSNLLDGSPRHLALMGRNYAHVAKILSEAIESGETRYEQLEIPGRKEQVLEINASPLRRPDRDGALAIIHDASKVVQLESMRHDFVANVTHELKTPLTSIRGYIDLLQSGPRDPDTVRQFYDIIEIEADRLQSLIRDMLELSEIENRLEPRREPLMLYTVADEVVNRMTPLAEKRQVSLHLEVDPAMQVYADETRMQQLLTNLVANAVTYNYPGGHVWIGGRNERDMSVIQVMDDGIGIPEDSQERIFERFYRVSKDRSREMGGTGLGLSIVKHIVSLYGGTIELSSRQAPSDRKRNGSAVPDDEVSEAYFASAPSGTTFTIRIPLRVKHQR